MKQLDLVGKRFGRLVVIEKVPGIPGTHTRWLCKCDCGNDHVVRGTSLKQGTKSCGCIIVERGTKMMTKHGHYKKPEYHVWKRMIERCMNTLSKDYPDYGGRGIKICERWLESFENFFEDIGERPSKDYSIDRIDVNGNYEPGNCRWATQTEQANNRRSNKHLEYNGIVKTMSEWAREFEISPSTLSLRLKLGWKVEDALTVPVVSGNRYVNILQQ